MGEGRGHSKGGISYQDKITLLLSYMFLPKEKIIYQSSTSYCDQKETKKLNIVFHREKIMVICCSKN